MKHYLYLIFSCLPLLGNGQIITTVGGNGGNHSGDGGSAVSAGMAPPVGGAVDRHGNYYFVPALSNRIRKIDTAGIIHTVAGTGSAGYNGDGILATSAQLNYPTGVAVDSNDNIYILDYFNYRIRKIDATTQLITTIAGNGISNFTGDGGLASIATVIPSHGICTDKLGNIYYGDSCLKIRKIDASGIITTIAGNGINGYSGDGGPAINASLSLSYGVCTDTQNNVYIGDASRVRKVDIVTGLITTIAGNGMDVFNGDTIPALTASFDTRGLAIDMYGSLYIGDYGNHRVRRIDSTGMIYTVAGNGIAGFSGDHSSADSAQLYQPEGIAVDKCGNLYIADKSNRRIRKVTYQDSCYEQQSTTMIATVALPTFTVYPNPATSQLTITSSTTLKEISITNTLGQTVQQQSYNVQKAILNIEHLQPGIYFVNATDAGGNRKIEKIIKQ